METLPYHAPNFFQPQNRAARMDAPFGGSFRSLNQESGSSSSESSSSADGESGFVAEAKKAGSKKRKDKQDDTQMSDGDSSGYSFSSDDELNMIAKKKHKRSGSLGDKQSVKNYDEDHAAQ